MNILITGAGGQLGCTFRDAMEGCEHAFFLTDVVSASEGVMPLDITSSGAVAKFLDANRIDVIINCAGYTDVERAESDEETAFEVNAHAVGVLADAASKRNITLIHISTDYVFDGTASEPYGEDAEPAPLSAYGRSKLAGELAVLASGCPHFIIRTSWLFSVHGKNFVKTILNKSAELPVMKVVSDQVGTPTYAGDLVEFILQLLEPENVTKTGIYNFTNEGVCSWYDLAYAVCTASGNLCEILPCKTGEFPVRAARPHYSVLDKSKVKAVFGVAIPHWTDALAHCLSNLI